MKWSNGKPDFLRPAIARQQRALACSRLGVHMRSAARPPLYGDPNAFEALIRREVLRDTELAASFRSIERAFETAGQRKPRPWPFANRN